MLALARGEGQSIIIDGHIEVKVVKWSRSSVRLAIQAPREITVDRDEIWRKMHPGEATPLEKAERERNERFAREGINPHTPNPPQPSRADHDSPHPTTTPAPAAASHETAIKAPAAGTFYTSAGPGGSPFVSLGSAVQPTTLIGSLKTSDGTAEKIIDLHAGTSGTVIHIHANNGQSVSSGQTLVTVRSESRL